MHPSGSVTLPRSAVQPALAGTRNSRFDLPASLARGRACLE